MDNEIETLIPTTQLRFIERERYRRDSGVTQSVAWILQQGFYRPGFEVDDVVVWRDVPLVKTMGAEIIDV
ncbi:MAG: hypothetical protein ACYDHF_08035 [Candidatus Cryosericum sp.]